MDIEPSFPEIREKKNTLRPEEDFKSNVFLVIIDSVISGLTARFKAANNINNTFKYRWCYLEMEEADLIKSCGSFSEKYYCDVSKDKLALEILDLKKSQKANFGDDPLQPFDLLNKLVEFNLEEMFGNIVIALCIFCCLPATVASAERSFSKLKHIQNFNRTTMLQELLNGLAILSIESKLARKLSFTHCIATFASKKARKVIF